MLLRLWTLTIGQPARRNRKPQSPSADAQPRGQSPVLSEFRHTGRTALCPNVFSTGSGPKPSHHVLLSFGWWDHYSLWLDMSTFLNGRILAQRGCHRKTRTLEPLIKSQGQRGLEPNIDKKAQAFSTVARFFFDNGRCMFCPGSGTKQAQSCVRCEREMK